MINSSHRLIMKLVEIVLEEGGASMSPDYYEKLAEGVIKIQDAVVEQDSANKEAA